jgi:transcriptional regulator with XRE-family HTH domain
MSRPVLAGLVGKSAEWVKAVENGRLLAPRLPLLIRIAEILQVSDLADLTGEQRLSAATYTKAGHEALPAVAAALADYSIDTTADSAGDSGPGSSRRRSGRPGRCGTARAGTAPRSRWSCRA